MKGFITSGIIGTIIVALLQVTSTKGDELYFIDETQEMFVTGPSLITAATICTDQEKTFQ